jgi:hypothetical protein
VQLEARLLLHLRIACEKRPVRSTGIAEPDRYFCHATRFPLFITSAMALSIALFAAVGTCRRLLQAIVWNCKPAAFIEDSVDEVLRIASRRTD